MYGYFGYGPLADAVTAIFENFLLSCMLIYGLVLGRRAWRTLAAMSQQEKVSQRLPVIKHSVKQFGVIYLLWWCCISTFDYCSDATSRRHASECERSTSPEYAALYFAEVCYVDGHENDIRSLVRLYDAKNGLLLAEEFVFNAEGPLKWKKTRDNAQWVEVPAKPYIVQRGWLADGDGTYGVSIELDPSWWDRMRAKLP